MSLPFLPFFLVLQGSFFMANDMVEGAPPPLRIMALNSWFAGSQVDDGLAKIAKHIEILQPDIVALQVPLFLTLGNTINTSSPQEISWADSVPKLTTLLGPKIWKGVIHSSTDTAILTRHKAICSSVLTYPCLQILLIVSGRHFPFVPTILGNWHFCVVEF
jgi:hypothetical protein